MDHVAEHAMQVRLSLPHSQKHRSLKSWREHGSKPELPRSSGPRSKFLTCQGSAREASLALYDRRASTSHRAHDPSVRGVPWRRYGMALIHILGLQLAIGVSMVLLHLPLPLADAHNAGAALLLIAVTSRNHRAWRASP